MLSSYSRKGPSPKIKTLAYAGQCFDSVCKSQHKLIRGLKIFVSLCPEIKRASLLMILSILTTCFCENSYFDQRHQTDLHGSYLTCQINTAIKQKVREARTGIFLHNLLRRFVIQNGRLKNCVARQQVLLNRACLDRVVI